ncbi:MAG: YeeE/YedE family protein [Spartobacteria bacterium]|nr:YeeE/YedE family protein [Spartobacteria bacterium]
MKAGKLVLVLMAGGLFGAGLAVSGMTDPARVIGFLDIFGAWDPALLCVMAVRSASMDLECWSCAVSKIEI